MEPVTLYLTLLAVGFLLIGAEIFIPGGILGIFGTGAWVWAAVVGWRNFSSPWNLLSGLFLLVAGILTFVVWIRYFPRSRMGKTLSLGASTAACKAHSPGTAFPVGTVGEALSNLRPSGIARFDGQRTDVVADGEWIEAGERVEIVSTSGGHISVSRAGEPAKQP